jgi:hypothetical protein
LGKEKTFKRPPKRFETPFKKKPKPKPKPKPKTFRKFDQVGFPKDSMEWSGEHYEKWAETLPDSQREAVLDYTDGKYRNVNRLLRDPSATIPRRAEIEADIKYITKALDSAPPLPENITVFRGLEDEALAKLIDQGKGAAAKGTIIQDKAFMSTSFWERSAKSFHASARSTKRLVMEIHVPKGAKGASMIPISDHHDELEFLLQRGTRMKVVSAELSAESSAYGTVEQVRRVVAEVVP